jgi:SET domain-containing protein
MGGCYMFRIDKDQIIDATRMGNGARFINHSCSPNSYARIGILPDLSSHIFIFALRNIFIDEEITYDYQFPIQDEEKLLCNCGSVNCSKRMN